MHSFEKIAELLITTVLFFLIPLQYAGAKADVVGRTYVMTETAYLVEAVRTTGRLSGQMYQEYLKRLGATGQVYDVKIIHYEKLLNETEEGYQTYYHGIYTEDILEALFSEEGSYVFSPGDFFRIEVCAVGPSLAERFSLFLRAGAKENGVQVIYGGRIRNEAG